MRKEFANHLYKIMKNNPDVWLISADLGFGLWDKIREDYPDRFLNTGASEQAMSDIAVGLALENKIPIVYSITPFLLYRAFETWRDYVNHENIKIILIGSGRDQDYKVDGFSHDATDDHLFMSHFKNIKSFWPPDSREACEVLDEAINGDSPTYINLTR
jgi:transketolase